MSILKDIYRLQTAEDFFNYFGVEYDENIVKPYRLHILKKFSLYMKEVMSDPDVKNDEEKLFITLKSYLILSYKQISENTPLKERLFKVHQEASKKYILNIDIPGKHHE